MNWAICSRIPSMLRHCITSSSSLMNKKHNLVKPLLPQHSNGSRTMTSLTNKKHNIVKSLLSPAPKMVHEPWFYQFCDCFFDAGNRYLHQGCINVSLLRDKLCSSKFVFCLNLAKCKRRIEWCRLWLPRVKSLLLT